MIPTDVANEVMVEREGAGAGETTEGQAWCRRAQVLPATVGPRAASLSSDVPCVLQQHFQMCLAKVLV